MFNPPNLKFKKIKKGKFKNKELSVNATGLCFGVCGIQLLHKGTLKFSQIEAARRVISKNIKGVGKLWVCGLPNNPRTSKPSEFRMGKGKGAVSHWVLNVKAGFVLFEVSYLSGQPNYDFMYTAVKKLPIKSKVLFKQGWV